MKLPLPIAGSHGFAMLVIVAGMSLLPRTASAQLLDPDQSALFQETINQEFFGVDARAMGMGNTGVASTRDGSALIYNPANLARVRRIEFRGGLSYLRHTNNTDIQPDGADVLQDGLGTNRTRISALSLVTPVPTYRGSLVFAFGVHRVASFDRAFGATIPEPELPDFKTSRGRENENGGLLKWSTGAAIDISPNISTGLALHVISGDDEYQWNRVYSNFVPSQTITLNQGITVNYIGVGATAGMSYAASPELSFGATIETPSYIRAEEKFEQVIDTAFSLYEWVDDGYSEYSITRPFSFGLGVEGSFDRLLLVGDMRYTNWAELGFGYEDGTTPDLHEDQFIRGNLKEAVSLHIGAEYLFPEQGVRLRAGYFRDPLPIDGSFIEKERQYFTLGGGFLLDRVMTVDVAYVHGGYELRDMDPGRFLADYKTRRFFITLAYRI